MAQISAVKNTSFPSNGKWFVTEKQNNKENKQGSSGSFASMFYSGQQELGHEYDMHCEWGALREQILQQWPRLAANEVDAAGPNRSYLAMVISGRYGVDVRLIKNYLRNLERHLPTI